MKKSILTLILAALSTGAMAEWVRVAGSDTRVLYIDPATIRKDGNVRKVWQIQDLKQRTKDGVMSMRALLEYDCKEERYRTLSLSTHSEPMASGKTLVSGSSQDDWDYMPPDSLGASALKAVCTMSAEAMDEWVKVGETDGAVAYFDPTAIRKNGNFRRVWEVLDLKERSPSGHMSLRMLSEYDCKEERYRILSLSTHSESRAGGRQLRSASVTGDWNDAAPKTIAEGNLKRVCGQ